MQFAGKDHGAIRHGNMVFVIANNYECITANRRRYDIGTLIFNIGVSPSLIFTIDERK